jgi:hypothetical protein
MKEAVPSLLNKIKRYQPLFLCVVGKTIWDAIQSVIDAPGAEINGIKVQAAREYVDTDIKGVSKSKKQRWKFGLQPYMMIHSENGAFVHDRSLLLSNLIVELEEKCVTIFFCVPCTSGRVTSHQVRLGDLIAMVLTSSMKQVTR